ncbi:hypothetical protein TDB9533_01992 [Thalassocella blandensis]|nr:hypothetical protein TDB9533_01992 [Thalassocella blandensis]
MNKPTFPQQLLDFLNQQPSEQVAQWLADTICTDKELKKQWQARLLLASNKPADYKKLLTQALPKKELLATSNLWRKVGHYFYEAETLFQLAFAQLDSQINDEGAKDETCKQSGPLTNEQQFTWLMQAFERLNLVLEGIDDSGGYRLNLEEELGERLITCFQQLDWSVEKKAAWLQEHQYKYDVFPYIPEQFNLPDALDQAFSAIVNEKTKNTA